MYAKERSTNIKQANFRPGLDSSYLREHTQASVKAAMPSGYNKGEQQHHMVPAELFGAFVQNLSRQEAEIVINRANELGIRVGNDPANLVGLDKLTEHLRNDQYSNTVHSRLDDIGLESSELSGDDRRQFYGLLNKIASAPLETRLQALPDFVTYIAEPAIEIAREKRPAAQSISQNKAQYKQELKDEKNYLNRQYYAEMLGVPAEVSETEARGKKLTQLLAGVQAIN